MADVPSWHSQLCKIRSDLDRLDIPVLDRETVERLFGLQRRSAIRPMADLDDFAAKLDGLSTSPASIEEP